MSLDLSMQKHAQRLCIYIGESDRWRGKALYIAILETLKANGIAGATVVRGVAGFGAHSRIHTATILRLSEDLPLRIEVIDAAEEIAPILDILTPMVREGLMTLEDVQVIRYTHRYLNPLPADKPVTEVMTSQVVTLEAHMTVAQAWQAMLEHNIKAMPVVDVQQRVIGMLTDEDLIHRASVKQHLSVAAKLDEQALDEQLAALRTSSLKVADVMSRPAITAHVSESLGIAAARMAKHQIKRLPVVDDTGKVLGVIARIDILRQVVSVETRPKKVHLPDGALRTVQQVMYTPIPTIPLNADLPAIVAALVEYAMRRLVVVDEQNRPVGLISDSDVISRIQPRERRGVLDALRGGAAPAGRIRADELMSAGVLTARPDTPLVEAARQMLSQHRKWLVVVDEQGKTLGLVDRQVLLQAITTG